LEKDSYTGYVARSSIIIVDFLPVVIIGGLAHHEGGDLVVNHLLEGSTVSVGGAFTDKKSKVANINLSGLEKVAFEPVILFLEPG
jgi:hypothetical protein